MLERGKISASQMGMMMFLAVVASGVMWIPGITGKYARNDLWLSPIWAAFIGVITVWTAIRLHRLYPQKSAIQYSEEILGRLGGKVIGFLMIFFYLHLTGFIVRSYAEFIVANFLHRTPVSVIVISMIGVCAFAVTGGVEVVGRTAQLFFPVFLIPVFFMPLLLGDMKLDYLFPVLEHGVLPSLKGALVPGGWFSEMFIMSFFLPYVKDVEKGMRSGFLTVFGITMLLTMINLFILFVLGKQVGDFLFPVMVAFRYISVAEFFENMESLIMAIWILGMFVKISVFYYVTVMGAGQWMRASEYRYLVLPFGLLIGLFSFWSYPDFDTGLQFDMYAFPFYGPSILTVLPLLLLLVGSLRKRQQSRSQVIRP
ncbi:GerAB/ArcD/ProY family transporter [Brevibacillus choshinensis]|uniref:Endospore germination permease n=1 Tax=Brevibacillus choshinensis TaxID=54911 RepID=A0ABX7FHC2_BRECH|nr:endospore germination permease [Brevibacillus choshinensis]QRG65082.1 endospore germination permease [Brevibacillus choshinensis]